MNISALCIVEESHHLDTFSPFDILQLKGGNGNRLQPYKPILFDNDMNVCHKNKGFWSPSCICKVSAPVLISI